MKVSLAVQIVLRDKNGKITKTINRKCHSFVKGIIDRLYEAMHGEAEVNTLYLVSDASSVLFGILAGTGTDAVTITDAALQTLILNGSTSGKLLYGSTSVGEPVTIGTTRQFTVARTLTNNSGGNITVEEVGLESRCVYPPTYTLLERSLLEFTINNGTSGTITYTISVTV